MFHVVAWTPVCQRIVTKRVACRWESAKKWATLSIADSRLAEEDMILVVSVTLTQLSCVYQKGIASRFEWGARTWRKLCDMVRPRAYAYGDLLCRSLGYDGGIQRGRSLYDDTEPLTSGVFISCAN